MILTIAWKECREHWPIWLTMVFMTVVLALGMSQISDRNDAQSTLGLTVLAMAATYGLVCGAMMLAGEREGGTLVFLDVFSGRRGLLWLCKFPVGIVLAFTEGLLVAVLLDILKLKPPDWIPVLLGSGRESLFGLPAMRAGNIDSSFWLIVLPILTVEAYAWGLLGSSLTKRVISGAVFAAFMAVPLWFMFLCTPPQVFLGVRVLAIVVVLLVSVGMFLTQARDAPLASAAPVREAHPLDKWIEDWHAVDRERRDSPREWERPTAPEVAIPVEELPPPPTVPPRLARAEILQRTAPLRPVPQARDPGQSLMWLTSRQAGLLVCLLAGAALVGGLLIPTQGQLLWPTLTLLLGIACGTAVFAWEQSDLSYQFLACQHFPLQTVWNVKVRFWFLVAVGGALLLFVPAVLIRMVDVASAPRALPVNRMGQLDFGPLLGVMGPLLYFCVWLIYGFCFSPIFVFFCRKIILAVLLSAMVSFMALGFWLPSVFCRGMSGWQLWVTPLVVLLASRFSMRAWAGGRIKERRPASMLIYFGLGAAVWAGLNFGYRALEIPNSAEPMDRPAFRAAMPAMDANAGALRIQEALGELEDANGKEGQWLPKIAEAALLPPGPLESLPADGQTPILRHLPECRKMTNRLQALVRSKRVQGDASGSFEHIAQILALSRSLRFKAPLESYLLGAECEKTALEELELLLEKARADSALVKRILAELSRHIAETLPPRDCLETECYRAGGMLLYPTTWAFFSGPNGRVPEGWMAGGIAFSLEIPWEAERRTRLWRGVWAGLFRNIDTPHWSLPSLAEPPTANEPTKMILKGWLPPADGSLTAERLARLLEASWLSDDRLFAEVVPLRAAADQSAWRTRAMRQTAALMLYQLEEKKTARKLEDLLPKYLAELPIDPYSGEKFCYRVSAGEVLEKLSTFGRLGQKVQPGQGILWSVGPDKTDHGGRRMGNGLIQADGVWPAQELDLVSVIPRKP